MLQWRQEENESTGAELDTKKAGTNLWNIFCQHTKKWILNASSTGSILSILPNNFFHRKFAVAEKWSKKRDRCLCNILAGKFTRAVLIFPNLIFERNWRFSCFGNCRTNHPTYLPTYLAVYRYGWHYENYTSQFEACFRFALLWCTEC